MIEKRLSVWRSEYDSNTKKIEGGPVQAIFGGASLETFSGEAQLKKSPCIYFNDENFLLNHEAGEWLEQYIELHYNNKPTFNLCFLLNLVFFSRFLK